MNKLKYLIEQTNDFSFQEEKEISQVFNTLFFNVDTLKKDSLDDKIHILGLKIEMLTKTIYSNLIENTKDKVQFIKYINKLKIQHEVFEILNQEDTDEAIQNLLETAERFGKKAQSSISTDSQD